jgi:hypothetical protein
VHPNFLAQEEMIGLFGWNWIFEIIQSVANFLISKWRKLRMAGFSFGKTRGQKIRVHTVSWPAANHPLPNP